MRPRSAPGEASVLPHTDGKGERRDHDSTHACPLLEVQAHAYDGRSVGRNSPEATLPGPRPGLLMTSLLAIALGDGVSPFAVWGGANSHSQEPAFERLSVVQESSP